MKERILEGFANEKKTLLSFAANCTAPGTYRDTTSNTCEPCPVGTYNSQKWVTRCLDCPTGESTQTTGSDDRNDCRSKLVIKFEWLWNPCVPCYL